MASKQYNIYTLAFWKVLMEKIAGRSSGAIHTTNNGITSAWRVAITHQFAIYPKVSWLTWLKEVYLHCWFTNIKSTWIQSTNIIISTK